MTTPILEKEFFRYFLHLDEIQKKTILKKMEAFLKEGPKLDAKTTREEYNQEIDEAMKRIDQGEFSSLEDLENEMKTW